jgi:predicted secreted protein
MVLIEILALAALVWILVLGLVLALCRSAQDADRLTAEQMVIESAPTGRFRSTA